MSRPLSYVLWKKKKQVAMGGWYTEVFEQNTSRKVPAIFEWSLPFIASLHELEGFPFLKYAAWQSGAGIF